MSDGQATRCRAFSHSAAFSQALATALKGTVLTSTPSLRSSWNKCQAESHWFSLALMAALYDTIVLRSCWHFPSNKIFNALAHRFASPQALTALLKQITSHFLGFCEAAVPETFPWASIESRLRWNRNETPLGELLAPQLLTANSLCSSGRMYFFRLPSTKPFFALQAA